MRHSYRPKRRVYKGNCPSEQASASRKLFPERDDQGNTNFVRGLDNEPIHTPPPPPKKKYPSDNICYDLLISLFSKDIFPNIKTQFPFLCWVNV